MRAAIYTRVSSDPKQRWRSVTEQEAECRAFAAGKGWDVVECFCDNDRSASRYARRTRPGFAALQAAIAAGACDVVLSWEGSRTQRDLEAFVQMRKLLEHHGVLWSYDGDVLDMRKARDRKRAAEDAVDAEYEVDKTRERILRSVRSSAAGGRPHGRRLYGFVRVYDPMTGALIGQTADEDEGPVVCRIVDAYLAGVGMRTIARELNDDGIPTSTGAKWESVQVYRVLTNPAYAGRRVHRGEVIGPASWEPLVDVEKFERVQARLDAQRTSGTRQTRTANLLTGVARCGVCGGKMKRGHDRSKRKTYVCGEKFCVGRDLGKLDLYVTSRLLERLATIDHADRGTVDPADDQARAEITEAEQRIADATQEFIAGMLTASTLAKIEGDLLARVRDLQGQLRRRAFPIVVDVPDPDRLAAWWGSLEPEQRRAVVGAFVAAVTVSRTKSGKGPLNTDAIAIEWR